MVTRNGLALAPKQFKFWRRILEYCGDGDRLSYRELEMICAEIYENTHLSQIGLTFNLFLKKGLLSEIDETDYLVKKDAECHKVKEHVAQKRGAENPPGIRIVSRDELQLIKNVGNLTRRKRWH
ncbi:MAG: hypothetical protein WCI57_00585 [Candidatus Berkelbacteria bacterium]